MISVMLKMHQMPWMEDCWMVGNSESKWHDMDVRRLRIVAVEVVVVEGEFSFLFQYLQLKILKRMIDRQGGRKRGREKEREREKMRANKLLIFQYKRISIIYSQITKQKQRPQAFAISFPQQVAQPRQRSQAFVQPQPQSLSFGQQELAWQVTLAQQVSGQAERQSFQIQVRVTLINFGQSNQLSFHGIKPLDRLFRITNQLSSIYFQGLS